MNMSNCFMLHLVLFASTIVSAPLQDKKLDDIIHQAFAVDRLSMTSSATHFSSYSLFPTHAPTDNLPALLPGLAVTASTAVVPTGTASRTFTRTVRPGRVDVTSTSIVPTATPTPYTTLSRTVRPGQIRTSTPVITTATTTTSSNPTPTATRPVRFLIPAANPVARAGGGGSASASGGRKTGGGGKSGECPLVLDINRDGIVSAALGTGISLNNSNWLERSGGATHGDKMLAMCDLNKNGMIDGTEVFGDLTEFPLWNKNISKEANGFDALGDVAKSLEKQYPDITIIEHRNSSSDTFVMLKPLQLALQRFGCDLGFISDDNRDPSKLEPLGDVAGIEINNYVEDPQAKLIRNGVASRQLGYYIDTKNQRWKVNDVWFIV